MWSPADRPSPTTTLNKTNTSKMPSTSDQPPHKSTPIGENPRAILEIATRVSVQLKHDWTEAEAMFAFLVHPTTKPFLLLKSGTTALVNLNQKSEGPLVNPLITIQPVQHTKTGLTYVLPWVDAGVDVPARSLRIGVRIVKAFGSGVPEFDNMALKTSTKTNTKTNTNTSQSENESFKAGDMAVYNHFAIDVPDIILIKKLGISPAKHPGGYYVYGAEQATPRDSFEYGLQMDGPVTVKK
ncbi:hypothetical protein BDP55DRAFT_625565 [Colletotrichum godetiae]|uniref:Uncharacterized protein n=1 Tax=Colletotrichum godetiae TaxID=1209918 RepID=A0AAJ0AZU0_9PEZI|nr:uncharacterized protein BDP55DRAFT_625565 [Colletotrichum godetiae]KAK1701329.1 hypothetical protein BDP55DRAFT_625565 [Colletotrichum godetiae]